MIDLKSILNEVFRADDMAKKIIEEAKKEGEKIIEAAKKQAEEILNNEIKRDIDRALNELNKKVITELKNYENEKELEKMEKMEKIRKKIEEEKEILIDSLLKLILGDLYERD